MVPWLIDVVSDPSFLKPVGVSILVNFVVYFSITKTFPSAFVRSQARGWLLTLGSSFFLLSTSFVLFLEFMNLPAGSSIKDMPNLDSEYSRQIARYFIGYMLADSAIGIVYYPDSFARILGWVHHVGYLIVIANMLKYGLPGGFLAFAAAMEISTVFLAIGHIYPPWRLDLPFGITFFVTRILLHGYLVHHTYLTWSNLFWLAPTFAWVLHIYWFSSWCRSYAKLGNKRV